MLGRATVALVVRVACLACLGAFASLTACNHDSPDDALIAAGNTSIPMGAVGAVGVSFDAPPPPPGEAAPPPRRRPDVKRRHLPPDPFADPPDTSDDGNDGGAATAPHPGPGPQSRHSGGTAL